VKAFVIVRTKNIGDMLQLIMEKRGEVRRLIRSTTRRVMLTAMMPLNEILRGLSRQDQKCYARLRFVGLRTCRLFKEGDLIQARHPRQQRASGCVLQYRTPVEGRDAGGHWR